jgi:hypothetical protein
MRAAGLRGTAVAAYLAVGSALLGGCRFDDYWTRGLALPAVVDLINESPSTLTLTGIYSAPGATTGFSLDPVTVEPGSTVTIRVTEGAYREIVAGRFVLEGSCGTVSEGKRSGRDLPRSASADTLAVDVRVPDCGSSSP